MKTLSVLLLSASTLFAQSTTPKQEKVLFQNEYVRVYEANLDPGERLQPHETGNRLIYSLTSYTLKYHWDNRVTEEKRKSGEIHFHPAGVHFEENAGKQRATFLLVERTSSPLPATEGTGLDMARVAPYNTKVLFDRDMAKVFEVSLPPKDNVPMHFGLNRVIYALTNLDLLITTPDGKQAKLTRRKGSVEWHLAGLHKVQNNIEVPARLVVFGFKR
jgi:hypothetical protein